MGQQEKRATEAVTALIAAKPLDLAESIREQLIRWLVIKLMVLDVLRDGEQVFTEAERRSFHEDWSIPTTLSVWLMRCGDGDWKTLFWSHAQALTLAVGDTAQGAKPPTLVGPNVKLFLWGLGEALIVALYQREVGLPLGMQDEFAIPLLPDCGKAWSWPPRSIDAEQAKRLTSTLVNLPETFNFRMIELDDPRG